MTTTNRTRESLLADLNEALDLVEETTTELERGKRTDSAEVRLELRKSRRLARKAVELLVAEALDQR
jgi:hypothetical protein